MLANLELEFELQGKITAAAHKLAQDTSMAKTVRKQRKQSYHKAYSKVSHNLANSPTTRPTQSKS